MDITTIRILCAFLAAAFLGFILLKQKRDRSKAEDLIEYVLMAGFAACAAGVVMPPVARSIQNLFITEDPASIEQRKIEKKSLIESALKNVTGRALIETKDNGGYWLVAREYRQGYDAGSYFYNVLKGPGTPWVPMEVHELALVTEHVFPRSTECSFESVAGKFLQQ